MDFELSEEQQLLSEMVNRFVAKDYSFDRRQRISRSPEGWSAQVWREFADLGLLALTLPEEYGGMNGGGVELMVVMQAFGRGLVVEPYLSTVLLGAGMVNDGASAQQKANLLPRIAQGQLTMALAHFEPGGRYERSRVTTRARRERSGWRLSGSKAVVLHGAMADRFLVSARNAGEREDPAGISLFLVDANHPGVAVRGYATHDGQRAADLALTDVQLGDEALVGKEGAAMPLIGHALDRAIAALCAEAVGVMQALNEATLEYTKTRRQFGVPIASFQALQHRMADMRIAYELAYSMAVYAALKASLDDAAERSRAMSAAKAVIGQSGRFIGQQAVQLHGGMGLTDELIVGHYFKRLTLINATLGDADHHLGRYSDTMPEARA